jgi:hypothetical protein
MKRKLFTTIGGAVAQNLSDYFESHGIKARPKKPNKKTPEEELQKQAEAYSHYLDHWGFWAATYSGGRNEAFFQGDTADDEYLEDYLWLDVDLTGAYPTALDSVPLVDWEVPPRVFNAEFRLGEEEISALRLAGVSESIISDLCSAFKKGPEIVEAFIQQLRTQK